MSRSILLHLLPLTVILLLNAISPSNVLAEGINLHTEFVFANSDGETTTNATGDVTNFESSLFTQRFNLDILKIIYPNLTLAGGGIVELDSTTSTTDGEETKIKESTLRPFIELNLNNPLYDGAIGYRKAGIRRKADATTWEFRETYNALLDWNPVDYPELNLFLIQNHLYDRPETSDLVEKILNFNTRYTAPKYLDVQYAYTRIEREDRINIFETRLQTHNGKVNYSNSFFNNQLIIDSQYTINHNSFEQPGRGTEVSPLSPSNGLFSTDNSPVDGPALVPVTSLIDGDITTSTGIELGWTDAGRDPRNIGLDFGFPTNIAEIFIRVTESMPSIAANSLSWSVYTSPDNTDTSTWTLMDPTIVSVSFEGGFDPHFVISFPAIKPRFIKVVVNPLSSAFNGDAALEHIFVTEMEALTTVFAQQEKIINVTHDYDLNLMGKLSNKTLIGYNLSYSLRKTGPLDERDTAISNSINLNHIFNEVFASSARVLRTDNDTTTEDTVDYAYGASVKATYLKTFGQTFSYSGTRVEEEDGSSNTNAVFLRNNAVLYNGWSAFLDTGYSWKKPLEGGKTTGTVVNAGTDLVPNEKITININYSSRKSKESGGENGEISTSHKRWDIQAFFIPFSTMSLFARSTTLDKDLSKETFQNYAVNWSPFPDGNLLLSLVYSETLRSVDEIKDKTVGPSLRWDINRHAVLVMSYSIIKSESTLETTDSQNFNTNLRMSF